MVTIMAIYFYMTYDFTLLDICSVCFDNENFLKISNFSKSIFYNAISFCASLNELKKIT